MERINEQTLIPIGIAILVIGSAALWVAGVNAQMTYASTAIAEVREDQKQYNSHLEEIRSRLSAIEGELKRIPKEGK
jgi:hypothetical protein